MDSTIKQNFKEKGTIAYKGCTYAITLTLNRDNMFDNKKHEHNLAFEKIYKFFRKVGQIQLYAELTDAGTIHYHGTLLVEDNIKYYKTLSKYVKELGFVKLKPIDDAEKWLAYCTKTKALMEEILECTMPFTLKGYEETLVSKKKKEYLRQQQLANPLACYNIISR